MRVCVCVCVYVCERVRVCMCCVRKRMQPGAHLKFDAPSIVCAILELCMPGKLSSFRMENAPSTAPAG